MEENITLQNVETKVTKGGKPMWRVTTSNGIMSCFYKPVADQLFTLINKNIIVEVEIQGQYKNLIRIIGMSEHAPIPSPISNLKPEIDPKIKQRMTSASMMIAFAKDLAVAGKIETKDIDSKAKDFLSLYEEMLEIKFT